MGSQMRLSTKLILAFGLLIVMQISGNVTSLMLMGNINTSVEDLSTNWLPSINAISDVDRQLQTLRRWEILHVISTNDTDMANYDKMITEKKADLDKATNRYEKLISSTDERNIYNNFRSDLTRYLATSEKVLSLSR